MICSSCGKEIDKKRFPANITFCPYCGDELHDSEDPNALQFCPYCGEKLIIQSKFCPHCGKKLLAGESPAPAPRKPEGKSFIEQTAKPVIESLKESFGPERKMRKLYKQWIEYSNLPPEEIPSINKDIESRNQPPASDPRRKTDEDFLS
ncbi:MAG: zinc ribbon domain-containing protein [Dehalococcoidales bacterium]